MIPNAPSLPLHRRPPEELALTLSMIGSAIFAVSGGLLGLYTGSGAILLDGFYSLMTLIMSFVSLKVARLIQQGPSRRYQFGYYGFEPLINTIKGIVVCTVSLFAFTAAVEALLHGGRDLVVGLALAYALLSSLGCFSFARIMGRYSDRLASPLLAVEARDWIVDGCVSCAVTLAFGLALFLNNTQWEFLLPYIDPLLVSVLTLVILPLPLRTVFEGVNQLLGAAPGVELEQQIQSTVDQLAQNLPSQRHHLQMMVQGRVLYVFIQVLVPADFVLQRVQELDQMRRRLTVAIEQLHPYPDIDILFTEDPYWLKDSPLESEPDIGHEQP